MLRIASACIAIVSLTNPALAAPGCATAADASALKTAVMQQQMMVAAFQCHEASAYNSFVTTFRTDLQSSDAALKAFFVRRGGEHGEAGYDTFKTKAANLSALEQARHAGAFCTDTHALFTAALAHPGNLASFVESRSVNADIGDICIQSRPVLANVEKPLSSAVRVAEARPASVAVDGVPALNLPAMPYRSADFRSDAPASTAQDASEDRASVYAYEEPSRRSYNTRGDDSARAYGPPPGWREYPAPRYGWRPRGYYGGSW